MNNILIYVCSMVMIGGMVWAAQGTYHTPVISQPAAQQVAIAK